MEQQIAYHTIPGTEVAYLFSAPIAEELQPPIVMVHGAYHDGRIWADHFIPYFVGAGHPVCAIHLKPQAKADHIQTLFAYTLADYVEQLEALIDHLDQAPFVIAHSMGGLVVMKYLNRHPGSVRGVCLLASLPYFGMKRTVWKMLFRPRILMAYILLTLYPKVAHHAVPPPGLLSDHVDMATKRHFGRLSVRESARALFNSLIPGIKPENLQQTNLLVLGAAEDNLALPEDVVRMGELLDSPAYIYPDMGHAMMLEARWEEVAGHIYKELLQRVDR